MTQFNPEKKELLSYGESLGPAMEITYPEDAKQYFLAYVAYLQKVRDEKDNFIAWNIALGNIGYYAGYYDSATRARVEKLFNAAHPIFASVNNKFSNEEILQMGIDAGKKSLEDGEEKEC